MAKNALQDSFGNSNWLRSLLDASPATELSLTAIADFLESDSALLAYEKFLFISAISAVKGRETDTRHWMARSLKSGLAPEAARHAAALMLLSRGIEVSRLMLLAIPIDGSSPSTDRTPLASPPSSEIFEYFTQVFGQLPDRITLLADHAPAALTYYYLLRKAGLEVGALQPRLSELMLVAINAAECQRDYVRIHADGALKKGANEAQLVEACVCAIPFSGVAAWFPASEAILSLRTSGT